MLRVVGGQFCRRGSQPPYHLRFSKLKMTRTSPFLPLDFYFAPEEMMFSKEVGEQNASESAVIALLLIWKTAQAVTLLCKLALQCRRIKKISISFLKEILQMLFPKEYLSLKLGKIPMAGHKFSLCDHICEYVQCNSY